MAVVSSWFEHSDPCRVIGMKNPTHNGETLSDSMLKLRHGQSRGKFGSSKCTSSAQASASWTVATTKRNSHRMRSRWCIYFSTRENTHRTINKTTSVCWLEIPRIMLVVLSGTTERNNSYTPDRETTLISVLSLTAVLQTVAIDILYGKNKDLPSWSTGYAAVFGCMVYGWWLLDRKESIDMRRKFWRNISGEYAKSAHWPIRYWNRRW